MKDQIEQIDVNNHEKNVSEKIKRKNQKETGTPRNINLK